MPPTPATTSPLERAVRHEFADRPTLRSVVTQVLAASLLQACPTLTTPLAQLRLALPRDGGGRSLEPVVDVALAYLATGSFPDLAPRQGLSTYLGDATGTRLKTDAQVIQTLVYELPTLVPIAFQNALALFWGQPDESSRWAWLSQLLQGNLRTAAIRQLAAGSTHLQQLAALADCPDRETRATLLWPENAVHAYTLETQVTWAGHSVTLQACDILLATAERAWLYRVSGTLEAYATLDDFAKVWGDRLAQQYLADRLTWRHYEPNGSIFDNQAALILNQQLEDLAGVSLPARGTVAALEQRYAAITDPSPLFEGQAPTLPRIEAQLPPWLKQASPADRFTYRQCLLQDASFRARNQGDSYLNGLDSLKVFAVKALNTALAAQHPKTNGWDAEQVRLTFKVAVGDLGSGYLETVHMTLTELAINNLSNKPKGRMSVAYGDGQPVEHWLTPSYIESLVSQVDIGATYPQYLRELLMGDSAQAQRREQLFSQQRPIQLVTLALEHMMRGEHNLTRRGYQYVNAVVSRHRAQRWVQADEIVIRPLALLRRPGASADRVQNMFIIEPRNIARGPHVLLRPSYPDALLQFETRQALLDAIARPGALQDSVLTWLPDLARPIYGNGGFTEPHYVRFGLGSDFDSLPPKPAPATLAGADDPSADELLQALGAGTLMHHLYASEARTLLDQAERDSTSNTESRWALILEGAQLGFNTLLTVARGPVAVVGWLLQLAMGLQQDIPALESHDATARELAWVDLLLNVGMLLVHMGLPTQAPRRIDSGNSRELALEPLRRLPEHTRVAPPVIKRGTAGLAAEPPGAGRTLVDFERSLSGDRASGRTLEQLTALSVPWPTPLPEPISIGEFQGLYKIGTQWHASVGGLLFRVSIVPGFGEVFIIHPAKPEHPGIQLKALGGGRWILDRGLKLVGGGPKRLQSGRQRLQNKRVELAAEGQRLLVEISALAEPLDGLQSDLEKASTSLAAQRKNLNEVWSLPPGTTEKQRVFLTKRYAEAKQGRQKARTQFNILLGNYRERLPATMELLQAQSKVLKDLVEAGGSMPGGEGVLQTAWQYQDHLQRMLANRAQDLSISESGERMQDLASRMYDDRALSNSSAYDEHQARMLDLFKTWDEMATVSSSMESLLEQLNQYSSAGRDLRSALLASIDPPAFFAKNIKLRATKALWLISIDKGATYLSPQESLYVEHMDKLGLYTILSTHIELRSSSGYALTEQREVYETIISNYRNYEGAIQALKTIESKTLIPPYADQLLTRVSEARALAESELEDVVRKQEELEVELPLSKTLKPRKTTKRVFKTRKKEFLIGDFTPADGKNTRDHMTIEDAGTGEILASYEAGDEGWSDPAAPREVPAAPLREVSLPSLRDQGRQLLAQRTAIEGWVKDGQLKLDKPATREDVNPADWGIVLTRHADKLDAVSEALQKHHPDSQTAANLAAEYRANAREITRWAEQVCSDAYKRQLPTMDGLQYLWDHKQIDINLTSKADPQRPTLSGDFFTEYAVYDKAEKPPKVLWYAHFHYASAATEAKPAFYTRAHLKLPEQRKYTQKDLLKAHVKADLLQRAAPGAEPLGKIIYVLITAPQDRLFLDILPT